MDLPRHKLLIIMLIAIVLSACGETQQRTISESTATQQHSNKLTLQQKQHSSSYPQQVYWGDQHVHTSNSADAAAAGTVVTPEDAVRFAKGEPVKSTSGQTAQLHRAMDWVVISDHSDSLGSLAALKKGNPEMLANPLVKKWYGMINQGGKIAENAKSEMVSAQAHNKLPAVLIDPKWSKRAWQDSVDVMEKYNDPGTFTAFIGFEWTSNGTVGQNLHRNVIFRGNADKTRDMTPLTTFVSSVPGRSGKDPESLWHWLEQWEAKTGGKVLAIPHNGNLSNGWMFRMARYDGSAMTKEWAQARQRWEPLYEVFQYKGASEAHPSLTANDELSKFEIWDTSDLGGNLKPEGAIKYEYARTALGHGLSIKKALGTNPFKFGMVGGTDTHNGLSAGGSENNFWGKFPLEEPSAKRWEHVYKKEQHGIRKTWTLSAQGLTGVWSTGNTRAELWDAMKRKEVYASSGPRIALRFFAGFDFQQQDIEHLVKAGYSKGVPMGADLKPSKNNNKLRFLVSAIKDPESANLDQIQIIKVWLDGDKQQQKVIPVVWSGDRKIENGALPAVGNTINKQKATYRNTIGSPMLTGYFVDEDFDPAQAALYYARAIEIPTPRWTLYDSVKYGIKMDPEVTMAVQERVVSSPIWYQPKATAL